MKPRTKCSKTVKVNKENLFFQIFWLYIYIKSKLEKTEQIAIKSIIYSQAFIEFCLVYSGLLCTEHNLVISFLISKKSVISKIIPISGTHEANKVK